MTTPGTARRTETVGTLLLLSAAALWSLNGVLIKYLHDQGMSAMAIAASRSLIAGLVLTPFIVKRPRTIQEKRWLAAAVIVFTGMCITFVLSMTRTTAANAIFLQYTAPAWVFLLSPFVTGDRATGPQTTAMILAFFGVTIIFWDQYAPGQSGLIIGIIAGVVFGLQSVVFRRAHRIDALVLVWCVCMGSSVIMMPFAFMSPAPIFTISLTGWLIFTGIVQFGIPYVLYSEGLKRVTAQKGVTLILLEPILSPVWVWLILGEIPVTSTFIGGAFIASSVVYIVILQIRSARRTPTATA